MYDKNHINIEILTSPKFKINIYQMKIKLIFRKYIKLRYKFVSNLNYNFHFFLKCKCNTTMKDFTN